MFVLMNILWIFVVDCIVWVFCMVLNSGIVILFFIFNVIVIVYVWVSFLFNGFRNLMWYLVILVFFGSFFFILLDI